MNSLRARFAALLVLAIVSVVALATFAASRALQPPPPEATMEPLARQLAMLAAMARTDRTSAEAAGLSIRTSPAQGRPEERMTGALAHALRHIGLPQAVFVSRSRDTPVLTASVDLGTGEWLVTDIPDMRPPPGVWTILAGWVLLIVTGSAAVSIFAASKITRPLKMLENAASRIGPDGVLAPIPEVGSGDVRATAHALNQLSSRLKSAMESRMRLVAAAGHDLRTPMTRMRLRAEFVTDDEERERWLADLQELDTIADSAIRLVREEIGTDESETVRLDRLVHEMAGELRGHGHKVEIGELVPLSVRARPVALTRALRNLVINAATHGGGAAVSLTRQGTSAALTIVDEGPGIPEELLEQVFEPFFRVDAARRKTMPGAGLGLAIAREIIERFGGQITLANRKPNGVIQTVKLAIIVDEGN